MEMTSAQAWAHLRHNVALPSEEHRFMAICSILDKWPDQLTRPAATDFAEHAIEAWTYDRRTSNASLETLPMISCPSSFRLARSLDLKVSPAREMGFLRDIPLDRISYLHLRGSSDAVHRLLTTANLPSLRYLELSCRLDEGFFYDPPSLLGILEGISIPRNAHVDAIRALFKEIELAGLKRIEIGGDTIRELRLESWPGSIQSLCVHGADAET